MYTPSTAKQAHAEMLLDPEYWSTPLMNFVDDLRRDPDITLITEPITPSTNGRFDNMIAAVVGHLCDELDLKQPDWIWEIKPPKEPWFVSGMENLKAFAIVESPVNFRTRNIFVMEDFLFRV